VTNAGEGTVGRIALQDTDGLSHEILHIHGRDVAIGDPVVAGQLIGTMETPASRRPVWKPDSFMCTII
jgi:hypothetical protein